SPWREVGPAAMTSAAAPTPERHNGELSLAQVKAVGQKRLLAELAKLNAAMPEGVLSIAADPKDVYVWNLVIAPVSCPF
uniref:UBC core domain-containing protein n=1 Tax=Steinernema glaseri TaxID=37863 RepID=A0A1I8ANQ5_9BILA